MITIIYILIIIMIISIAVSYTLAYSAYRAKEYGFVIFFVGVVLLEVLSIGLDIQLLKIFSNGH